MFKFFLSSLGDDDMGGGDEQGRGGEHREAGEGDQAEPVQHHRRELPVVLHRVVLLVRLQLVGEDAQLLEDHRQLPHGARWQWGHLLRLEEGQFVWRSEWICFSQHPKLTISENLFVLPKTFVTNKLC